MFDLLTLACGIGCALIAGFLFAFSVCIMRALGTLPPAQGMPAMQAINVVILNPWFLGVFVGTVLMCAVLLVWTVARGQWSASAGQLAGSLLYLVGVVLITRVCNIPRNNALAAAASESAEGAALWERYLATWTFWNHIRTAAGVSAAVAFLAPRWLGW